MNSDRQKHIVIILGMNRTGANAITRSLRVMGIDLANDFLTPKSDNDKGFREDQGINALHMGQLIALGHERHTLTPILPEEIAAPITEEFKLRAVEILRKKLNATHRLGLKDSRVVQLLPFGRAYLISCKLE